MPKSRRRSTKKSAKGGSKSVPLDKALYNQVKKEAMARFRSWPSAYGSGWLVREYKRRGGRYSSAKTSRKEGLSRWYKYEKWIDVCYWPEIVPCGRSGSIKDKDYWKRFPYCRPLKRATKKSPKPVTELSKREIKRRCSLKRKSPKKVLSKARIGPKKSIKRKA